MTPYTSSTRSHTALACLLAALATPPCFAVSDLYMRDTVTDSGAEPYTGPGPVYLSPDIWVRNDPDPNFDPRPFPTTSPGWTPLPHQNPEYRNAKTSHPNYVYVRVHNRGDQPSSGTERLRLYQAKASTGLSWPASWVDNKGMICSADRLLGIEITKPRLNAKSVTPAVRNAYRDAVVAIGSDTNYQYSDMVQYFRKQNAVHSSPNPEHGNPAFLPWHREMINRYEQLLREVDPLVTLLYWDFTESPTSGTSLLTTSFMGASSGTVSTPLVPLRPPTLSRNAGGTATDSSGNIVCSAGLFQTDATFNAMGSYPTVSSAIEQVPNHDCAHGFIGGYGMFGAGQISSLSTAAEDPFFFMLHANVDRQWANWQRQNADPDRLDPVSVYGSDSSNLRINATMNPWSGVSGLAPWSGAGAETNKNAKDRSIVYPPVYDTAPLRIPPLQPGESVVIETPWFPPDVNDYNCAGQAGHFCLLARIETSTTAPFGMTNPEGINVDTNTRNNNNVAWKNVTIVDNMTDSPLLLIATGTMIRNIFDREAIFEIALVDRTEEHRFVLPELTRVSLVLPKEILERIRERKAHFRDLKFTRDEKTRQEHLQVVGKAPRFSVWMKPGETFTIQLVVDLEMGKIPRALLSEPFHYDIEQRVDLPTEIVTALCAQQALEVGGVRFTLDFKQILKDRDMDEGRAVPGSLRLQLIAPHMKALSGVESAALESVQHLSVDEPVEVAVYPEGTQGIKLRSLILEVDGREVARADRTTELHDSVSFDKPGVYTLTTRGIGENGEILEHRTRVLVSEDIPPNAMITKPVSGDRFELGETIQVIAEAAPAFQRKVTEVSLYAKEGDLIETGFDLVRSPNYKPVASAGGAGPHEFAFTPERAGRYMLQLGAVDDKGNVGVSGHVMVMVIK